MDLPWTCWHAESPRNDTVKFVPQSHSDLMVAGLTIDNVQGLDVFHVDGENADNREMNGGSPY